MTTGFAVTRVLMMDSVIRLRNVAYNLDNSICTFGPSTLSAEHFHEMACELLSLADVFDGCVGGQQHASGVDCGSASTRSDP